MALRYAEEPEAEASRLSACRYEVQGEYVIPSVAAIPKSAAEMALMQGIAGGHGASSGPTVSLSSRQTGAGGSRWGPQSTNLCQPPHAVQLTFRSRDRSALQQRRHSAMWPVQDDESSGRCFHRAAL